MVFTQAANSSDRSLNRSAIHETVRVRNARIGTGQTAAPQRGWPRSTRQRRQSGQVEALQRQIERLDVLATHLAEYSGTSAS
jgi:hypothetical protein